MADIKRVNYFTHQFLVEKDFDDEQEYHVAMRRRHNRVNHSWGVAEGLEVTKSKNKEVTISSGTAIDNEGQEIVLLESTSVDLTAFAANTDVYVSVSYREVFDEADHYTSGGVDNYTRTSERPMLASSTDIPDPLPGNGLVITLARVHLDGSGNVDAAIDGTMRKTAGSKIGPAAVSTNELADNAVTVAKIANNSVTAAKIAKGQVGAAELANGSVTNTKLANNAVDAAKIADGSVGTAELASNAVNTAKIADDSVTAAKIAKGQVGAGELANGSVINTKLADNAVTTAKIADDSVTAAKIAKGQVSASELANGSVINTKIADKAVNAAKILDGSVGTAELANDSVSVQKLKTRLCWDSTTSIAANAERGFNCIAFSLDKPRGASLLIYAYSTTNGARFEWREQSTTGGSPPYWINQAVYFHNLSSITISVIFKIYEILEV